MKTLRSLLYQAGAYLLYGVSFLLFLTSLVPRLVMSTFILLSIMRVLHLSFYTGKSSGMDFEKLVYLIPIFMGLKLAFEIRGFFRGFKETNHLN